jgi:hypothetical protein
VELDAWALKKVNAATGVNVARMLDNNMALYGELVNDPAKFVDVLFALVGEQAAQKGVSEEQFYRGLQGDALEAAYGAFWEAFADFSPRHLREILRAVTEKAKVAGENKLKEVMDTIRAMGTGAESTSSPSASRPPESPGSTPAA